MSGTVTAFPAPDAIENTQVANILRKLNTGKVLTNREQEQVREWQERDKASKQAGQKGATKVLRKLNSRVERFIALQMAEGLTGAEAYRRVWNRPEIPDQQAAKSAYRINIRPSVAARMAELRALTQAKTILSINDRFKILSEIAQDPRSNRPTRIRAVEVYSKIAGDTKTPAAGSSIADSFADLVKGVDGAKTEKFAS